MDELLETLPQVAVTVRTYDPAGVPSETMGGWELPPPPPQALARSANAIMNENPSDQRREGGRFRMHFIAVAGRRTNTKAASRTGHAGSG